MSESTETNVGAEESSASITSAEDKFFGVKTQIVKKSKEKEALSESDDFDLEIVDDKPPVSKAEATEEGPDEELSEYSAKVRKRIKQATWERRKAERLADEAVKAAQQLNQQNQNLSAKNKEYESLINRGETALVSQIKQKAQLAAEKAKAEYKKAHEEGNTDDIVSSQERMIEAQSQMQEAERYERSLPQQPTQQQQMAQQQQLAYQQQQQAYQQQQQQPVNSVPEPEPKAKEWGEKNAWFGDEEHKGMTAYAYALHEEAIKDNGLSPNSDQYFEYIDVGMRGRFSEYEWSENTSKDVSGGGQTAPSTTARPSSVVAPSARNNGAKPRKMKLTSSQVSLAKRLGLTNAQYANQLVKEMTNGR